MTANQPPNTNDMLVVKQLSKSFNKVHAVDRMSFNVARGEVFGLLGPNGAGKTTTVRMLSALIAPTSGEAWVAGYKLGKQDQDIRRNVGILTEAPGLYDGLSAERNLEFYAHMYEVEDIPTQVEKHLRMLGLWDRRFEPVSTFSKGMRQKLAIARALLHEPKILFLDEPTSGLDPEMALVVRTFIHDLKAEGRTIVLCTHNLDEADRLCDRVAVIRTRLLALDNPKALRRQLYGRTVVFHLGQPADAYRSLFDDKDNIKSVQTVDNKLVLGLEDPESANPDIIRELIQAGADIQFVGEIKQSLEDVYLQLVRATEETKE